MSLMSPLLQFPTLFCSGMTDEAKAALLSLALGPSGMPEQNRMGLRNDQWLHQGCLVNVHDVHIERDALLLLGSEQA